MSQKQHLGDIIKLALKAAKITQDDLAGKMGVSRQTINSHLSKAVIDKDFLQKLLEETGIDYTDYYDSPDGSNKMLGKELPRPDRWQRLLSLPTQLFKKIPDPVSEDIETLNELRIEFEQLQKELEELKNKKKEN